MELAFPTGIPPKAATASKWVNDSSAPVFCLLAPAPIATPPAQLAPGLPGEAGSYGGLKKTPEVLGLYDLTAQTATALKARAMLFVTPPSLAPSPGGVKGLRDFFGSVTRPDGVHLVWEPHGPWEDEEIKALCEELSLVRCVDPLRDSIPEGSVAYARLGPFAAMGRSLADDELEDIADALEPFEEAFCFFATDRALSDATRLEKILSS